MGAGIPPADGSTTTVGAERANAALKLNLEAQSGVLAPAKLPVLLVQDAALPAHLRANAGRLSFADAHDAAYHAHQHAMDLPSPPAAADELAAYLRAARKVIKDNEGEMVPEQRPGVRNVYFRNSRGDRAIVFVDASGNAYISTFIVKK